MKQFVTTLLILATFILQAQDKYLTKSGSLGFEASVPSFEEVKAKNESVTVILNTENGEIAALLLVKGFRFKNALMEEHFNENYAESELYPKATFRGKIVNFSMDGLEGSKIQKVTIEGKLDFHGKTKQVSHITANISKNEHIISIEGSFIVQASDFNIEIPKIVKNKLSNEVHVAFNFDLVKK
ncbi:YceI family protein [Xanthomarina gelatinilytica]|uniref:YceI family protein n=1 Tax=Xanthomarina gelatinilytica TaxID=1137281 RepID=UPI003AA849AC